MNRESVIATIAAACLMLAVFALGVSVVADEYDVRINLSVLAAMTVAALGFVGLAAIVWHLVRRLMG